MTTPHALDRHLTLRIAVARYDELRLRDSLVDPDDPDGVAPLDQAEALELLALGELIARKAVAGRQLTVRTARSTGASWAQIGRALDTTRQSAWEAAHPLDRRAGRAAQRRHPVGLRRRRRRRGTVPGGEPRARRRRGRA